MQEGDAVRVCIHRGAKQIGGTCIEIESQGKRLVLDIGQPLDCPDPESADMPTVHKLAREGARAQGMVCVFPTVTWPNHVALVTGAVVAVIGLLAAIAVPNMVRARTQSQLNACINNLRKIVVGEALDTKEAATKAVQEKKDIQQRNIRYSILLGLAGALIFLVVVYRQRNKISKEKTYWKQGCK